MPDITYEETKRAIAMVAMSSRLENNCAEESLWQKTTYIMRTSRETNTFVTSQTILKKLEIHKIEGFHCKRNFLAIRTSKNLETLLSDCLVFDFFAHTARTTLRSFLKFWPKIFEDFLT